MSTLLDRNLFVGDTSEFVKTHRAELRGLLGTKIGSSWVAWDASDDTWFNDEAVIIEVGERRLEIVCWKLNEMALTWNAIDLGARPAWVAEWGVEFALEWRVDALAPLRRAKGHVIRGVAVIEHLYKFNMEIEGGVRHGESWLLHGLELEHEAGLLTVYNGLDEAGVTDERQVGSEFRRIEV